MKVSCVRFTLSPSGRDTLPDVLKTRREQRLLANSTLRAISTTDHICDTVRKVLFQQAAFRDFKCARAVTEQMNHINVLNAS